MALSIIHTAETIQAMELYLDKKRPPKDIRHKIDIDYKIEKQSIIIYEVRPHWMKKGEKIESEIAKATWVKARQCWKLYWLRASLKWDSYQPVPEVDTVNEFLEIVDEDRYGCFWG
jgi:hypothetical protein